jgi:hypothetical protein
LGALFSSWEWSATRTAFVQKLTSGELHLPRELAELEKTRRLGQKGNHL